MSIPVFGDPASLPREVGGLSYEATEVYPDPRFGVSFRYGGGDGVKADAYLYDLGLPIPDELDAPEVVGWFKEACQGVMMAAQRGIYRDLEVRAACFLHAPADAPEPFCLWASFAYRQAPGPGVAFTGLRLSHLGLRTDCGYINKVRYTFAGDPGEAGTERFVAFFTEWTATVQEQGATG